MEEQVGQWWHRAITRMADRAHADATVRLEAMRRPIGMLFQAAGGSAAVRLAPAQARHHAGPRGWLQRIAGSGERADLPHLEPEVLALPESIAVFADAGLNRELYLWLAALAGQHRADEDWITGNLRATERALARFPGLRARWRRLLDAVRAGRPAANRLRGGARLAEAQVQAALAACARGDFDHVAAGPVQPAQVAPVWIWLDASPAAGDAPARSPTAAPARQDERRPKATAAGQRRRRAQRVQDPSERNAMMLFFRAESILTWSEMVRVNRATDDDENPDAERAADDMDQLAIADGGQASASRVRFDLDLPSAAADDLPLGDGERLPEWDWRSRQLRPEHCALQLVSARDPQPWQADAALRATAHRVRRRMESLRAAPRWQRGCHDGDELDLDAWVRCRTDVPDDDPPVHARRVRAERSLATLLMADLSLSTETYIPGTGRRVVDVIRDALFVVGEALAASGDAFEVRGFSSVKRQHVRIQHMKDFDEPWGPAAQARIGAIKPGYYTRMGAAIRHATGRLAARTERQRLLLLLTDGKPNDLDQYEGRYGLEDTRQAVAEARAAGLVPFAVTVDERGHDWLPYLFGRPSYALVHRPQQLAQRLAQVVATLART
jgi:nitric oxide reductase NorD protein